MTNRTYDRIYELDWRSLGYPITDQLAEPRLRSRIWEIGKWLDQGPDGACVGFAFGHELSGPPVVHDHVDYGYALGIYHDAQRIDPWPGGAYPGADPFYEGTSLLAGAKVCRDRGYYHSFYWALDLEQLVLGVVNAGPSVIGVGWYADMENPDRDGFITPTGRHRGGHAVALSGVVLKVKGEDRPLTRVGQSWWQRLLDFIRRLFTGGSAPTPYVPIPPPAPPEPEPVWADIDLDESYFVVWNSWGRSWGDNGTAKLRLSDMEQLLALQGEACFPIFRGG